MQAERKRGRRKFSAKKGSRAKGESELGTRLETCDGSGMWNARKREGRAGKEFGGGEKMGKEEMECRREVERKGEERGKYRKEQRVEYEEKRD